MKSMLRASSALPLAALAMVAFAAPAYAQDAAKDNIRNVRSMFEQDVEKVRALGVNVHVPTPAEMEQWQIAARRPYARWKATIGPQLVGKVEEVVAASRGKKA